VKNYITEFLYKIKSLEAIYQNIIVSHDVTKKQRDECRELVAEAKKKVIRGTCCTRSGAHLAIGTGRLCK